ncbi:Short-chain dehydrogenase/reductase [Trema orientale]|uniref:Short-chain dehydrogenase/reductase n=1 Tax=Trema orientale TaxID=63057 RepID=A0A2P5F0U5_TREOI|nr:Short-chain dehydrogenase/reductase [Trema orientale]
MEYQDFTMVIVCALGLVSFLKSSINFLKWVWIMFLRPPKNLKEYGSWAIITGATDGIGKALAFELASKGLNLVLVGRNPSKLEATSREIHGVVHEVEVKSVVVDLAKSSGKEIVDIIGKETKGLDVGILVNNAGLAYPYPRFFHDVDLELMESILKVNMEAATWMVLSVLPGMLKKKKGAIVNIGSASTTIVPSYPLFTVYAATKAYLAMLSRCISIEYKQSGIDTQCQIPVFVATKMTKLKASSIFIASPETYSKASVRSIGYGHLCTPYWSHSLQWFITNALPDNLLNWCTYSYFVAVNKTAKLKEISRHKKLPPAQNSVE